MRKTAPLQNLLARRQAARVIERFGGEDFARWPFWAAGEAHATRGRAYAEIGDPAKAEADFAAALGFNPGKQTRELIEKARVGKRQR